jgi:hypothetical protein
MESMLVLQPKLSASECLMASDRLSDIKSVIPKSFCTILLCLAFFPFTPAVFAEYYTQPFYLIFSWIVILYALFVRTNLQISSTALLIIPLLVLCIAFSVFNHDLNALAVMLTISSTFLLWSFLRTGLFSNHIYVATVLHWAIVIWLVLAIIHFSGYNTFLVPSHFANAPEVLKASGRGVLSFAPEPTHYALHTAALIVLKLLCDRKVWFFVASLTVLLLTSLSSTLIFLSLTAFCISSVYQIFATSMNRSSIPVRSFILCALISLVFIVVMPFVGQFLVSDSSTRIGSLLSLISKASLADLMDSLELDGSSCARVNGLIQSIRLSLSSFLLPHGFASPIWQQARLEYCQYSGVGLSASVPSGYFSLLFVYGFMAIPLLSFLLYKSCVNFRIAGRIGQVYSFAVALAALIPVTQLHFSDPSLLLAILIPEFTHASFNRSNLADNLEPS